MAAVRLTRWEKSVPPKAHHFKISFDLQVNLKQAVLNLRQENNVLRSNYGVIRDKYVYVVFFRGFVNCCKISSLQEAEEAVDHFLKLIGVDECERRRNKLNFSVDNITLSGKFAVDVRLGSLWENLNKILPKVLGTVSFRPSYFAAMHIKLNKAEGGGVITLYHTGSYSLVGVDSEVRANEVYKFIWNLLDQVHQSLGKTLL